jgi:HIRAN domain-containing protein
VFRRARQRTIEWRRVAHFELVRVDGAPVAEEEAADQSSGKAGLHDGMRVALRRERGNEADPTAVAVDSLDEQRLAHLPAEVAARVAPLLDSGRFAFDGRIYAVEPADSESTTRGASFYLALTQFELRPVERFSPALAIRALLHLPVRSANWCLGRAIALYHALGDSPAGPPDRYAADDSSRG